MFQRVCKSRLVSGLGIALHYYMAVMTLLMHGKYDNSWPPHDGEQPRIKTIMA